jgi:PAS domain S-box-containing protein
MSLSAEWAQFFELSRDLLCVLDFDGHLREHSRSWEALTGRSQSELRNASFTDFLHPDDRKKAVGELVSLKQSATPAKVVGRFRCAGGMYKWLRWTFSADLERGRICGIASNMNDSSALENEDLRRTNQTLNSIITASPHAIIAVDAERRVRIWNPAAERMFGWSSEETVGGRVPFVTDASREASDTFNQRALKGEDFTNFEIQRSKRDGTPIDLLVSAAPTYDERGQIDGFLTVATDVTEQKSLERQFLRTQRMESVGSLVGGSRTISTTCLRLFVWRWICSVQRCRILLHSEHSTR